jgi:hypothetical protein
MLESHGTTSSDESEDNKVVIDVEISELLDAELDQTCLPGSKKLEFWKSGIIAERKHKRLKKAKDYLVEALPVWRRKGGDGDLARKHIDEWNAMIKDRSDLALHLENDKYDIIVHRMHPRFERLTKDDGQFPRNFGFAAPETEPPPTVARERDDRRDKQAAMELLGYLIESLMERADADTLLRLGTWRESLFDNMDRNVDIGRTATPSEARAKGWSFLRHISPTVRRDFGEQLLSHEAVPDFSVWTHALCIALLPPETIMTAWRKHGIKDRSKKYRSAITTFLEEYHADGIHNRESFIYILRTFYTSADLLRRDVDEEDVEAAHAEANTDRGDHSNVEEDVVVEPDASGRTSETSGQSDSRANPDDSPSHDEDEDDEDESEPEPETEETRMKELEEKAKKAAGQPTSGMRVTRGQKRKALTDA